MSRSYRTMRPLRQVAASTTRVRRPPRKRRQFHKRSSRGFRVPAQRGAASAGYKSFWALQGAVRLVLTPSRRCCRRPSHAHALSSALLAPRRSPSLRRVRAISAAPLRVRQSKLSSSAVHPSWHQHARTAQRPNGHCRWPTPPLASRAISAVRTRIRRRTQPKPGRSPQVSAGCMGLAYASAPSLALV